MSEVRKGYQLSLWLRPDDKFLMSLVNSINNQYGPVAFVKTKKGKNSNMRLVDKSAVFIDVAYWKSCCSYVESNCNIIPQQ